MNTGETILTIGSLILLSLFTLTLTSHNVQEQTTLYNSGQVIEAIGIAQKYIEKAELLNFDEDKSAMSTGAFTEPDYLGPDYGENVNTYDDIDDYNGLSVTETLGSIPYSVSIDVDYVAETSPYQQVAYRTYIKQIKVTVSSSKFSENTPPLVLKKLFAYHYFFSE